MGAGVWGLLAVVVFGGVVAREAAAGGMCPRESALAAFFEARDWCSVSEGASGGGGWDLVGVTEGDDNTLHDILNMVHKTRGSYVALLFYASWCPFSKLCRPDFNSLSSLFPSVRHFAFEESAIKLSTLSRYGVHGFPTLFLMNSTVRVRYHGSRTINSLASFYSDITGTKPTSLSLLSSGKPTNSQNDFKLKEDMELENCPFSWARSPEKMLQQDTYLLLATAFVIIRLLYYLTPKFLSCISRAWQRHTSYTSLMSLSHICLDQVKQLVWGVHPCKRGNLQGGAMCATAWASKSLASVSIGETSSGSVRSSSETR